MTAQPRRKPAKIPQDPKIAKELREADEKARQAAAERRDELIERLREA